MQYTNFGKFIKCKRLSSFGGLSLNKFALDNDLEPATLSRIENEKQGISLTVLGKIAGGFGMSGAGLLQEYEKKYKN